MSRQWLLFALLSLAGCSDAAVSGITPDAGHSKDGAGHPADAATDALHARQDAKEADAASDAASGPTFVEVRNKALSGCGGGFGPLHCHDTAPFGGMLDLNPASAYGELVGVDSIAHPGIPRVKPGDANGSMLYRKLTNHLAKDGSEGNPMPEGEAIQWSEPPYADLVRDWINAGAHQ